MKFLVTGATGYIGRNLTRKLVDLGNDVCVIVRPGSDTSFLKGLAPSVRLATYSGSISELQTILAEFAPDVVFHLASYFKADHITSDVVPMIEANVLFGAQLLESMRVAGVNKIVCASTAWEHFEDSDFDPVCLYAATKKAFEDILTFYAQARGLSAVILKIFECFGPDDPRRKIFSLLTDLSSQNAAPLGMTAGQQRLHCVYIDDIVAAFIAAGDDLLKIEQSGVQTFALSSDRPVSLRELVADFEAVVGRSLPIIWGERPYRQREVMEPWSKGVRLPGWVPKVSLRAGIAKLIKNQD